MHFHSVVRIATAVLLASPAIHASALFPRAEENGPCTDAAGTPGVCIPTTKCTSGGGTFTSNRCPGTPDDIKCCTKKSCGSGGNCRWTNQCSGTTVANQCPGPAGFKCCQAGPPPAGGGPYPPPSIPGVGSCQAVAVSGAQAVVAQFPGKVREIFCIRDCACGSGSDHCCGKAIDYMCSDAGGVRTEAGRPIAEWIMNNRASLNLKYVIWGQRIWSPSRDEVKPWDQWRSQGDRGSITANHWDHVHASFN